MICTLKFKSSCGTAGLTQCLGVVTGRRSGTPCPPSLGSELRRLRRDSAFILRQVFGPTKPAGKGWITFSDPQHFKVQRCHQIHPLSPWKWKNLPGRWTRTEIGWEAPLDTKTVLKRFCELLGSKEMLFTHLSQCTLFSLLLTDRKRERT